MTIRGNGRDASQDSEIDVGQRKAEVLAQAASVFGTQRKAETWIAEPASGLNGHRPIDLLATRAGADLVKQFLTRLDYGVHT